MSTYASMQQHLRMCECALPFWTQTRSRRLWRDLGERSDPVSHQSNKNHHHRRLFIIKQDAILNEESLIRVVWVALAALYGAGYGAGHGAGYGAGHGADSLGVVAHHGDRATSRSRGRELKS